MIEPGLWFLIEPSRDIACCSNGVRTSPIGVPRDVAKLPRRMTRKERIEGRREGAAQGRDLVLQRRRKSSG